MTSEQDMDWFAKVPKVGLWSCIMGLKYLIKTMNV
jgi:hypothetical protein